jgi:hypothetical protein
LSAPLENIMDMRLQRLERRARDLGDKEIADAIAGMLRGGQNFEAALGLVSCGGHSWRRRARESRRNNAYLALGKFIAASCSARTRAAEVERVVGRYEATGWLRDQRAGRDEVALSEDPQRLLKFDILNSGARPLSCERLRKLFEKYGE